MVGRAIFVGNFEYGSGGEELERAFARFGTVARMDLKKGFAFVFMRHPADGQSAIDELDGRPFGDRRRLLKVEWARGDGIVKRREDERRRRPLEPSETLFVVNFDPRSTRQADLEERFDRFGNIVRLDLQQRFAFVQYESVDHATDAMRDMHGSYLRGRKLIVEYTVRGASGAGRKRDRDFRDDRRWDRDRERDAYRRRSPSPRGRRDYRRRSMSPGADREYRRRSLSPGGDREYRRRDQSPRRSRSPRPVNRDRSRSPRPVYRSPSHSPRSYKRSRSRSRSRSPRAFRRSRSRSPRRDLDPDGRAMRERDRPRDYERERFDRSRRRAAPPPRRWRSRSRSPSPKRTRDDSGVRSNSDGYQRGRNVRDPPENDSFGSGRRAGSAGIDEAREAPSDPTGPTGMPRTPSPYAVDRPMAV